MSSARFPKVWSLSLALATPAVVGLVLCVWPSSSHGYEEDVDEAGTDAGSNHSGAHYDLTLTMARCAGYPLADATTIASADEATDKTSFGGVSFNFTNRGGPNLTYFHFPQTWSAGTVQGALHEITPWAAPGSTSSLTLFGGSCSQCCGGGGGCVDAGTLEAFGIRLHSIGDHWSHKECEDLDGGSHDAPDGGFVDGSVYAAYCQVDMHKCEFGDPDAASGACDAAPAYFIDPTQTNNLRKTALTGLKEVRNAIFERAPLDGHTKRGDVFDANLEAFAALSQPVDRVAKANDIWAGCYGHCMVTCQANGGSYSSCQTTCTQ
jgi:hypothetical protein